MAMHATINYSILNLFGFLIIMMSLLGCTATHSHCHPVSVSGVMPVEWTQELSMAGLLADEVTVNTQENLFDLLGKPWYSSIDVKVNEDKEIKSLNSCNDVFAIKEYDFRAQYEYENDALLEFKVMCKATRLLSQAAPAQYSNIPAIPLDDQLTNKLPKSLALITSQSAWDRIQLSQDITHWGDVNSIIKVEQKSAYQSVYYSDSGTQVVSILGSGDVDGDNWNDILVTVRDSVVGGTYFNLRLFILTVTAQNEWRVVAQYS